MVSNTVSSRAENAALDADLSKHQGNPPTASGPDFQLARLIGLWPHLDAPARVALVDQAHKAAGVGAIPEADIQQAVAQLAADWLTGPNDESR